MHVSRPTLVSTLSVLLGITFGACFLGCSTGDDSVTFVVRDDDCDGIPDSADPDHHDMDPDVDGVYGACDNCPFEANASQTNTDFLDDGGNACDTDDDEDGVLDVVDICPLFPNVSQDATDGDADGFPNACDNCPTTANGTQANADTDIRGDACDNCPSVANVNLAPTDCNGDGDTLDAGEGAGGQCDRDADGIGNACDIGG